MKGGGNVISPKAAKLIEYLPKGVVKYIANKMLESYMNKYANIKASGLENLEGIKRPIIFICNHLSNSDALVLERVLRKEDVTFVAGVKLSHNATTNLGIHIVKTTTLKPNSADKEGITRIISILKNGGNILIFPEGTRSRTKSMIEAKKGILLIAKFSNASVVPVGIHGSEKLLPINESDMSKEEFNYADVYVNIGKEIKVPEKLSSEDRHAYEERVLNSFMTKIAELIPESYRGVYSLNKNS